MTAHDRLPDRPSRPRPPRRRVPLPVLRAQATPQRTRVRPVALHGRVPTEGRT